LISGPDQRRVRLSSEGRGMDVERILSWLPILTPVVILGMAAAMIFSRKR
jgi:hypothetical protein